MHLLPPQYTSTGKKKGKQKWASSEAKRRADELGKEWEKKKQQWASLSNPKTKKPFVPIVKYKIPIVPENRRAKGDSIDTGVKGAVTVKQTQHYTGDRLLGITILHKSCLQPVFSQEQAIDAAHMRR